MLFDLLKCFVEGLQKAFAEYKKTREKKTVWSLNQLEK